MKVDFLNLLSIHGEYSCLYIYRRNSLLNIEKSLETWSFTTLVSLQAIYKKSFLVAKYYSILEKLQASWC